MCVYQEGGGGKVLDPHLGGELQHLLSWKEVTWGGLNSLSPPPLARSNHIQSQHSRDCSPQSWGGKVLTRKVCRGRGHLPLRLPPGSAAGGSQPHVLFHQQCGRIHPVNSRSCFRVQPWWDRKKSKGQQSTRAPFCLHARSEGAPPGTVEASGRQPQRPFAETPRPSILFQEAQQPRHVCVSFLPEVIWGGA